MQNNSNINHYNKWRLMHIKNTSLKVPVLLSLNFLLFSHQTVWISLFHRRWISHFQIKPWSFLSQLSDWHISCLSSLAFPCYTTSLGVWNVIPHASPAFHSPSPAAHHQSLRSILPSDWTSPILKRCLRNMVKLEEWRGVGGGLLTLLSCLTEWVLREHTSFCNLPDP